MTQPKLSNTTSTHSRLGKFTGAVVLTALVALIGACSNTTEPTAQAPAPEAPGNVTTEDIAEDTNQYIGQTVTIRSEPIEKIGPVTFTIENEQFFGGEPVLVVNASGTPFVLPEGDDIEIQVTGQVQRLNVAELGQQYGLELDPTQYQDYENRPGIIAQSIAIAPKPGELTENPSQYYGQPLAVTGEVENIQGANSFTLDEDQLLGGDDLLVIYTDGPTVAIDDGETVAVTGVLRPFVLADLERDYDLTWDLEVKQKLEAEYSTKPVLVAEGVYPSAIPEGL